ncbi:MAG: DUF58 domain-containing protein [Herpetosiphon sp.]
MTVERALNVTRTGLSDGIIPSRFMLFVLLTAAFFLAAGGLYPALIWLIPTFWGVTITLLIIDWFLSPWPARVMVARTYDTRLALNVDNNVRVVIHNSTHISLQIAVRDEYPTSFISSHIISALPVPPNGNATFIYNVRPMTRGDFEFGATTLRISSRLKLFTYQIKYQTEATARVYPNIGDIHKYDLLARKSLLSAPGLRHTKYFGEGTQFERLRDYTPDDEFRRINWKVTARLNRPIAVDYEPEREQHLMFVLDTSRLMRGPIGTLTKLDYAVHAALLAGYVAGLHGDQAGLLTFADDVGAFVPPRKGKGQFFVLLETLYALGTQPVEADFQRAFAYLHTKQPKRSFIVLFTDIQHVESAHSLIKVLRYTTRHHVPLVVTITDPDLLRLGSQPLDRALAVYERAVAGQLLDERKIVAQMLNQAGILTLDVAADKLSVGVINRYLSLKGKSRL